ncbi:collagen-like triple helix repeat-containing protein [Flagellimonas sp. W118]|uniref:collagen-like triple helix repeat-containing protein n=1 Tax=Flagellimonas sp. W118 TaxID=3410791 RepID=UPI003BF56F15
MRLLKLFNAALLCAAITLTSCSGEDGTDGLDGGPGAPGLNGTPGTNGDDGVNCWDLNGDGLATITTDDDTNEDRNGDNEVNSLDCQGETGETGPTGEVGNANVQAFVYHVNDLVNADYDTLNIPLDVYIDVENDDISNYAYLVYLETTNGLIYSIPGHGSNNTHYARVFVDPSNVQIVVQFYNLDDNDFLVPQNLYENIIVVAVEVTNNFNNGGGQTVKGSSEGIEEALKAAGVDANDYDAVATYYGL